MLGSLVRDTTKSTTTGINMVILVLIPMEDMVLEEDTIKVVVVEEDTIKVKVVAVEEDTIKVKVVADVRFRFHVVDETRTTTMAVVPAVVTMLAVVVLAVVTMLAVSDP